MLRGYPEAEILAPTLSFFLLSPWFVVASVPGNRNRCTDAGGLTTGG